MVLEQILNYEYTGTILFYMCVGILLYLNRHHFEREGIVALMRTSVGLGLMDRWASRYRESIKLSALVAIGIGFIGMVGTTVMIVFSVAKLFIQPVAMEGSPVIIPGTPVAGMGGVVFPLVTGWITLFIVIVVHEFAHGVVARAHKLKVKSSGIVFFGPILGAFVEPDEKKMEKRSDVQQYGVMSAGPVSNLVLALVVFLASMFLMAPLAQSISEPVGVEVRVQDGYPAAESQLEDDTLINQVDGEPVKNSSDFISALEGIKPGDEVLLANDEREFAMEATEHPQNESRGYLGVYIEAAREAKGSSLVMQGVYAAVTWIKELFFWVWFISFNVGLVNLFPIFITDGARMLKIAMQKLITNQDTAYRTWIVVNKVCTAVVILMIIYPLLSWIFGFG